MKLAWFIAWRYLFSKKSTNAINLITAISVLGFTVGAFALITILSALNGFESLVGGMIRDFDPQLKIEKVKGKTFDLDSLTLSKISSQPGVSRSFGVIEENGVVEYNDKYAIVKLRGLPHQYPKWKEIDHIIAAGTFELTKGNIPSGVFGAGVAIRLGIHPSQIQFCNIYMPSANAGHSTLNPADALTTDRILVGGIYMLQEEIDNTYVLLPVEVMRKLLDYGNKVSYVEIILKEGVSEEQLKKKLQEIMGKDFRVIDRLEQNESIFKVFKSEKLATYAILAFVLLLSAFNTVGSVSMIIADKRNDIAVLRSLGAEDSHLKAIFLRLGMSISVLGGFLGLMMGLLFCWAQMTWGWIKLENSVVAEYPVKVIGSDVILVMATVLILGFLTSLYPAWKSARNRGVSLYGARNI